MHNCIHAWSSVIAGQMSVAMFGHYYIHTHLSIVYFTSLFGVPGWELCVLFSK